MFGLSISLPGKDDSPLVKKLNERNYSNLILRTQSHQIEINDSNNNYGTFGHIYLGKYNDNSCLIKVSYDYIPDMTCLDYKKLFIELNAIMTQHEIIPNIFSYNYIDDFETIQTPDKIYEKSEYIDKINTSYSECIYILCIEQYTYDLFDLYKNNLLIKNKVIVEERLIGIFNKLARLKFFFADMKLENIVIRLTEDENVSDLKIIDIDPIFCLPYDALFEISITNETEINELIMIIYKQIFHFRSASILFENNTSIIKFYNKFSSILKIKYKSSFMLAYLRNLLSVR
jgi:hypothetical protein